MDEESALASLIKSALPKLRNLEPLLELLQELGVQNLEDLNYIQESEHLKPVEARKLRSHFRTTSMCFNVYTVKLSYEANIQSK